jgi:hypothetical protein
MMQMQTQMRTQLRLRRPDVLCYPVIGRATMRLVRWVVCRRIGDVVGRSSNSWVLLRRSGLYALDRLDSLFDDVDLICLLPGLLAPECVSFRYDFCSNL